MENYDLYLPTHLIFGRGRIDELPSLLPAKGSRILLAMGGGSIRRIGLYDKLRELLSDYEVFDFSGIEPNPKISTIRRAVELCKAQKIDFIVAAGGGSVIDAVKCIAAGAYYDGDPWDLVLDHSRIGRAIPFCAVLTLSATGSDYDNSGVISNSATNEKMFLAASNLFPQASILDPTYTFTVPANRPRPDRRTSSLTHSSSISLKRAIPSRMPCAKGFCGLFLSMRPRPLRLPTTMKPAPSS